ncbi:ATP-binding protein [Streptomyces collinus]|uniref:ATP-binding protein n=1 Tax=Streptomyces collinus TaxID=42684 RepID=UPI0036E43FAB
MRYEIRDYFCVPGCVPSPEPFKQQFSSTTRGARLARLLATQQLADWGWVRDSESLDAAEVVVGELAANAVTHGRVPGRDFLLTMALTSLSEGRSGILRIEVADCRGERLPIPDEAPCPSGEQGRGLLLVSALTLRWGVTPRFPSGKRVWAELQGPPGTSGV